MDSDLRRKIVDFIAEYSETVDLRRSIISDAFSNCVKVKEKIDYSGSAKIFASNLVNELILFGSCHDGNRSELTLCTLLNTIGHQYEVAKEASELCRAVKNDSRTPVRRSSKYGLIATLPWVVAFLLLPLLIWFTLFDKDPGTDLGDFIVITPIANDSSQTLFPWTGNDEQISEPKITDETVTVENITDKMMMYEVLLGASQSVTVTNGILIAQPERPLMPFERTANLDTLIATIYVEGEEHMAVTVLPYLRFPNIPTVNLGFGQTVPTNQWHTLIWSQITSAMKWNNNDFEDELERIRNTYDIPTVGNIRLAQELTLQRSENTVIGFNIQLVPTTSQNSMNATVYISSLTWLDLDQD